jgi:uncharacterized protein (TIGR02147 family)
MSEINIFLANDYRQVLELLHGAHPQKRGYFSRLAEAMKCHRSLLPQVMRGDVNLTTDQGADLCRYWEFSDEESEFFLDLILWERASSKTHKKILSARLSAVRQRQKQIATQLTHPSLSRDTEQMLYYGSWIYGAIHVLASIPKFAHRNALAEHLHLPEETVAEAIQVMVNMGLMQEVGGRIAVTSKQIHLSAKSPMATISHLQWRLKAMQTPGPNKDNLHYSGVFAMSSETWTDLRSRLLQTIKDFHAAIGPSKEELLGVMNIDFFAP